MIFSIQNHRITITDFRPCSICQSYNQANILLLRLQIVIYNSSLPCVRLRYFLGGDRPSQTNNYTMSKK
jgi:hypothetical protein